MNDINHTYFKNNFITDKELKKPVFDNKFINQKYGRFVRYGTKYFSEFAREYHCVFSNDSFDFLIRHFPFKPIENLIGIVLNKDLRELFCYRQSASIPWESEPDENQYCTCYYDFCADLVLDYIKFVESCKTKEFVKK